MKKGALKPTTKNVKNSEDGQEQTVNQAQPTIMEVFPPDSSIQKEDIL